MQIVYFFCHLTLEFFLKGKIAEKTERMFPTTHDLEDLARRAKLELPPELKQELTIINTFNIAGRYDDYKFAFYKRATASYTKKYYQITKQILLWLKKQ
ncbi:MAG: HEPN domain-containing protein [Patescibacteria group bacterium]